jgi:hypothetical protein
MKVTLTTGSRAGKEVDLPEVDAKKLIKKGHAKGKAKAKKDK